MDQKVSSLWAGLSQRQVMEMVVPGMAIGLLGGVVAGGLGAIGGLSPALALTAAVSLAIPLALSGALYDLLLSMGRMPLGPLAPMALFWAVFFPITRVINAALVNLIAGDPVAVPHGWLDFIVYNILLSVGFAIGFWWLHQNYAPRWWFRLRDSNPVANYFINSQLRFIGWQSEQREEQKRARRDKRATKRRGSKPGSAQAPQGKGDDARLS